MEHLHSVRASLLEFVVEVFISEKVCMDSVCANRPNTFSVSELGCV